MPYDTFGADAAAIEQRIQSILRNLEASNSLERRERLLVELEMLRDKLRSRDAQANVMMQRLPYGYLASIMSRWFGRGGGFNVL